MDNLKSTFVLSSVFEEIFELLKRYLNRKKVSLKYNLQSNIPTIESSPFILQFLIFYAVDSFLKKSIPDSSIVVSITSENNIIRIVIKYEGEFIETPVTEIWPLSNIQEIAYLTDISISSDEKIITINIPV